MTNSIISLATIFLLIFFFTKAKKKLKLYLKYFKTIIPIIIALCTVSIIIIFPKDSVEAARNGLQTWFNIVLPALLPFFICSEILVGLGVVNFIGTLLQPLMNPIFNVRGEGAFPLVMSVTSGYPVGVKLASKLRIAETITQTEAQRLVSFCSTSGPLFMIGAVSVGMFNDVRIGSLIAFSHYLGVLTVGILFSFYKRKDKTLVNKPQRNIIKASIKNLLEARKEDGRAIGVLMGDAVKDGMNTMLMVGGFIILYSVIIRVLHVTNTFEVISNIIISISPISLRKDILIAALSGFVEITNGCKIVSSISSTTLITRISIVSLLIGWSGFSIHSQAMTVLSKTDIKIKIYILSKGLHGIFAFIYSQILFRLIYKNYITTSSILDSSIKKYVFTPNWFAVFKFSFAMLIMIISMLIIIGTILCLINKIQHKNTL